MTSYGLEELLEKIRKGYSPEAVKDILAIAQNREKNAQTDKKGQYADTIGQVILERLPPLSEEERTRLREMYPCLFLTDADAVYLGDILKNSKECQDYISVKELCGSRDDNELSKHIAQNIYNGLSEDERERFTASDIAGIMKYMPVMNLGVIQTTGSGRHAAFKEFISGHIKFFEEHPELAVRMLVQHYMRDGEQIYNGRLDQFLEDARNEMREIGLGKNGNK